MLFSAIILVGLFFFIQTHQTRNVEKQKTSNKPRNGNNKISQNYQANRSPDK